MKGIFTFLFIAIIFLFNCKSRIDSRVQIISDFLPQLADSLKIDYINFKLIPPPIYDDSIFIGIDSVLYEKRKDLREKFLDSLKKEKPKILLAINDTVKLIYFDKAELFLKFDRFIYDSILKTNNSYDKNFFNIVMTKDKFDLEKFELIPFNELVERYGAYSKVWYGIRDRFFGGYVHIESILLNEEKDQGIIRLSYLKIPVDGSDYIITIEKEKEKWLLKKIW